MAHGDVENTAAEHDGAAGAGGDTNGGAKHDTLLPAVEVSNVKVDEGKALKIAIYGMVNAMMAIPILYGYAAIIFRYVLLTRWGACTSPNGSYRIR